MNRGPPGPYDPPSGPTGRDAPPKGPGSAPRVRDPDPFACDPERGCITCSDEGVPMRVVEAGPDGLAACEDGDGRRSDVMTGVVGRVEPGDLLLVHAGAALLRLEDDDEDEEART